MAASGSGSTGFLPPRARLSIARLAPHTLGLWLFGVFFGMGAVEWLPGIRHEWFRWAILALFFVSLGLVLGPAVAARRLQLPSGLLGVPGFAALVVLSVPGIVQTSTLFPVFDYLADIGRGALLLWCFYHVARRGDDVTAIFRGAFLIGTGFAAAALVVLWFELPDRSSPCYQLEEIRHTAGFNVRQTEWGIGMAILFPCLIFLTLHGRRAQTVPGTVLRYAAAVPIAAAVFYSGSRTGMAMAVVTVAGLLMAPSCRRLGVWLLLSLLVVGRLVSSSPACMEHLTSGPLETPEWADVDIVAPKFSAPAPEVGDWLSELRRRLGDLFLRPAPDPGPDAGEGEAEPRPWPRPLPGWIAATQAWFGTVDESGALNEFTSRRLTAYLHSLIRLSERPLIGYGIRGLLLPGRETRWIEIHNLWLKLAMYLGVAAPLCFLAMVGAVVSKAPRVLRDDAGDEGGLSTSVALGLIVVVGAVASLFEPNALLGNFHYTAIWWAAAGYLVGRRRQDALHSEHQPEHEEVVPAAEEGSGREEEHEDEAGRERSRHGAGQVQGVGVA